MLDRELKGSTKIQSLGQDNNNSAKENPLADPAIKNRKTIEIARSIASIIIALSGLILLLDKVIDINLSNNFGFPSTKTFIWVLCQSLSPMLWGIASNFRPYKIAHCIPIYLYTIQLYWVFDASLKLDDLLLHVYAFGAVIAFVVMMRTINLKIYHANQEGDKQIKMLESLLDLYFKTDNGEK